MKSAGDSSWYDRFWSDASRLQTSPREHAWYRFLLRHVLGTHVDDTSRILEVGCGTGILGALYPMRFHFGTDFSAVALLGAKQNGLRVATAALPNLPYPDGRFDCALCCEVMEHLEEPRRALAEIVRVVRPGGVIILTMPQYTNWWFFPMMMAKVGVPFFRRYMDRQRRENMGIAGQVASWLREMNNVTVLTRASCRLSPPFWEYLFPRALRRAGFAFFDRLEESSARFPLAFLGLHAVFVARKQ